MNWSEGFWRLWLFVSFVWAIGLVATFIGFGGLQAPSRYYYSPTADALDPSYWSLREADEFRDGRELTITFPDEIAISFVSVVSRGKKAIWLRAMEGPGAGADTWLADPGDNRARTQISDLHTRAASIRRQEAIRSGATWACVLLGPPILLLMIGLSIRWVLRGFRTGTSPNSLG